MTWEKAYKADIGIELRFLKDRLSLQGDFFDEDRRDILLERKSIPNVTGISTAVYANMGHVRNRGVDAVLEWRDTSPGGFYYSFYGNFTYAHNHIVEDDTPHPRYDCSKPAAAGSTSHSATSRSASSPAKRRSPTAPRRPS